MESEYYSTVFTSGSIFYVDRSEEILELEWVKHPVFSGVFLKHMIKGVDTHGLFSSHLVKIENNCCLETHNHKSQWELHEVIQGAGYLKLAEKQLDYFSGKMAIIPKGMNHSVQADHNGLMLMAKFFPALL